MKHVKNYKKFLNEKKLPKLTIDIDELIDMLKDDQIEIFNRFGVNKDEVSVVDDIEQLYTNSRFNDKLVKKGFKKGKPNNSSDIETLLDDKYVLKFFFLYDEGEIEIEEPRIIILQAYNKENGKHTRILGFENKDKIE